MRILCLLLVVLAFSCQQRESGETVVVFQFLPVYNTSFYLERVSLVEEAPTRLDSISVDGSMNQVVFRMPKTEESIYQIRIPGVLNRVYFINTQDTVRIQTVATDLSQYEFEEGSINAATKAFLDKLREAERTILSNKMSQRGKASPGVDPLESSYKKQSLAFLDSTSSPGGFLLVYNRMDFGLDFQTQSRVLDKAVQRFPFHDGIRALRQETLKYISIYQEEFEPGEQLPDLTLPDINNQSFSTSSLRGSYVFYDIWSSWCMSCLSSIDQKKQLAATYAKGGLEIVNIALDRDLRKWQSVVNGYGVPGIHLIDQKMWRGNAATTLKFDSIPFNFLVDPKGKVLAKGIRPDSLLPTVKKHLGQVK